MLHTYPATHRDTDAVAPDDFCPVTLLESSRVHSVTHDCAVEYRDHVYYLANQRCMFRFLAAPDRYQVKVGACVCACVRVSVRARVLCACAHYFLFFVFFCFVRTCMHTGR